MYIIFKTHFREELYISGAGLEAASTTEGRRWLQEFHVDCSPVYVLDQLF